MTASGYRSGIIADIARLHADYARQWGFGLVFEAKMAGRSET